MRPPAIFFPAFQARNGEREMRMKKMEFPGMDMEQAFAAFPGVAYGRSLTLSHSSGLQRSLTSAGLLRSLMRRGQSTPRGKQKLSILLRRGAIEHLR